MSVGACYQPAHIIAGRLHVLPSSADVAGTHAVSIVQELASLPVHDARDGLRVFAEFVLARTS